LTKKTSQTKRTNVLTKEFKKKQERLREIREGREKYERNRKKKIPGFGIGVKAMHKDYGRGIIISESMHYFHRVDLELDKSITLGCANCKVVSVWPGHLQKIGSSRRQK
tara:strand:+ start:118 stop:444 length:327 start_codon:yes stop_codon:yes gene_type:complete